MVQVSTVLVGRPERQGRQKHAEKGRTENRRTTTVERVSGRRDGRVTEDAKKQEIFPDKNYSIEKCAQTFAA